MGKRVVVKGMMSRRMLKERFESFCFNPDETYVTERRLDECAAKILKLAKEAGISYRRVHSLLHMSPGRQHLKEIARGNCQRVWDKTRRRIVALYCHLHEIEPAEFPAESEVTGIIPY